MSKLFYKLAKNNKSMPIDKQKKLCKQFQIDDSIFIITKRFVVLDKFTGNFIYTDKSVYLICEHHRLNIKDFNFLFFKSRKMLKKRLKSVQGRVNDILLKNDKFDWDECQPLINKTQKTIEKYFKLLHKLDKNFPFDSYYWNFDPNDRKVGLSISYDSLIKKGVVNDKSLDRQIDCVNDNHMFVLIAENLYWCQNCGTICKTESNLDVSRRNIFNKVIKDDKEMLFPLSPHFLPKK